MILFEKALGWERADVLYSSDSMIMHDSHSNPLAKALDAEWARRRPEIESMLRARCEGRGAGAGNDIRGSRFSWRSRELPPPPSSVAHHAPRLVALRRVAPLSSSSVSPCL